MTLIGIFFKINNTKAFWGIWGNVNTGMTCSGSHEDEPLQSPTPGELIAAAVSYWLLPANKGAEQEYKGKPIPARCGAPESLHFWPEDFASLAKNSELFCGWRLPAQPPSIPLSFKSVRPELRSSNLPTFLSHFPHRCFLPVNFLQACFSGEIELNRYEEVSI